MGLALGCGSSGGAPGAAADGEAGAAAEAAGPESGADAPTGTKGVHCARSPGPGPGYVDAGAPVPGQLALPQVSYEGGPLLAQPTLIAVTYAGDPEAPDLEDFVASIGCTAYWRATAGEYGIGDAVAGPPVRVAESAPANLNDSVLGAWLARKIDGNDPLFPRPAPGTVYVIFFPATTQITEGTGGTSCVSFSGYHESAALSDGTPLIYAVLPRCSTQAAQLTASASHEIVEAVTDPIPDTQPAYGLPDSNHLGWALAGAGEVGDMCDFLPDSVFQPAGFPWAVQRIWSNRAAGQKTNPCVPAATTDYFYAAPVMADSVTLDLTGVPQTVAAVHVPVGGSATVAVKLVGSARVQIAVSALDAAHLTGATPRLTLTLDAPVGVPGDTLHLTITKLFGDPSGAEAFGLVTIANGQQSFFWGITAD